MARWWIVSINANVCEVMAATGFYRIPCNIASDFRAQCLPYVEVSGFRAFHIRKALSSEFLHGVTRILQNLVLTVKLKSCSTGDHQCEFQHNFCIRVTVHGANFCGRVMPQMTTKARNGDAQKCKTLPSKLMWVLAQSLSVWVRAQWQSQWCSQWAFPECWSIQ